MLCSFTYRQRGRRHYNNPLDKNNRDEGRASSNSLTQSHLLWLRESHCKAAVAAASVASMEAAPSRSIRVTTLYKRPQSKLPVFHQDDVAWLIAESITPGTSGNELASAVQVSLALSVRGIDAQPDVLVLAHASRLLLVQLIAVQDEVPPSSIKDGTNHAGFDLMASVLIGDVGMLLPAFEGALLGGVSIRLTSLYASEIAYLLHHTFGLQSSILDIDLLAAALKAEGHSRFNPLNLAEGLLGPAAGLYLSLQPDDFQVTRGTTILVNDFLWDLIGNVRIASAGYAAATSATLACVEGFENADDVLEQCTVDTRRVPKRLLAELARYTAVETALQIAKPKESIARLKFRSRAADTADNDLLSERADIEAIPSEKETLQFDVVNEQYKHRISRNTRQVMHVTVQDGTQTRQYMAKAVSGTGKTSRLQFVGHDADAAANVLRRVTLNDAGDNGDAQVKNIVVRGREDHSTPELDGMHWRRSIMTLSSNQDGRPQSSAHRVDQANLLWPLLFGDSYNNKSGNVAYLDKNTKNLFERPFQQGFQIIARQQKLNASQARAARTILSPLASMPPASQTDELAPSHLSADTERIVGDRLIIVHGPPGTGKTSLITAVCQQFAQSCAYKEGAMAAQSVVAQTDLPYFNDQMVGKDDDGKQQQQQQRNAIYACCQSNVAVKNIGETLSRGKVDFRIIVSPNFYVEWHEDLYADIKPRLIRTDELPERRSELVRKLGDCYVILSTISFFSHPRIVKGDELLRLRPMRLMMVDEASQIHLRHYPQLLERFGRTLGRIVFLGDDCQLAPFQSEEFLDAGASVFDIKHLRSKAFLLDTCYRLPKPLVSFISDNIYEGKVQVAEHNVSPPRGLLDCVAFVDLDSATEQMHGTSRINRREVEAIVALVQAYKDNGGDMSELKVLATYDAQRDALEAALTRAQLTGATDLVCSVDSAQGRESDHIILSLVRDGRPREIGASAAVSARRAAVKLLQPNLGFLKNERRSNVALTRCKRSICIVSSRRFVIDVGGDSLIGRLQSELQWSEEGSELHWIEEEDAMAGRLPRHLYDFND